MPRSAQAERWPEQRRPVAVPPENWQDQAIVSPTILESGPYRFFFFSSDRAGAAARACGMRERKLAKFWLVPVRLATNASDSGAHEIDTDLSGSRGAARGRDF